jgi:hypothetical protein
VRRTTQGVDYRTRRILTPVLAALAGMLLACGSPTAPGLQEVSGSVTDRIAGGAIDGATITYTGAVTRSAPVSAGSYRVPDLPLGDYAVIIEGPSIVTHETRRVSVGDGRELSFSVLEWGSGRFGAVYDETFHQAFHQMARVYHGTLRKWEVAPSEICIVEGTVPPDVFQGVVDAVRELNEETIPALWCGRMGPLPITVGPCTTFTGEGPIVVRPNWDEGSSGGPVGGPRSGAVAINVFRPSERRLQTRTEIRSLLAHELFHVAFAYHLCGGDLGANPFGFGLTNCPYPDSLMANTGLLAHVTPSPQDRLAACIVNHPDTHEGNRLPDTNPAY